MQIGARRKPLNTMIVPWLLGALLSCCGSVPALGQYRFDHWTTDNGLPQNTIRSLVQTRDGYLWLTTFDGLVRFDGVRFTVFDKNNSPGIINNRFTNIAEDKDGTLYATTEDGGLTVCRQGVFTSYTSANGLPGARAENFKLDSNGEALIFVDSRFNVYLRDSKFIPAPPEYQINLQRDFYLGRSGRSWVIDPQGVKSDRTGQTIHYPFAFEALSMNFHVKLYEDRAGSLWVGSPVGLYQIRDGLVRRYMEKDGLPPRAFMHPYCEDPEGGIWFITGPIRTTDNGLARYKDGRFTFFGAESGLPGTDIGQVIVDREGTIWIGTAHGLYRARKQLVTAYSTDQGLAGKEVYPLLETRSGDIVIGTTEGISRLRDGRFTTILPVTETAFVQALWEDPRRRLWVGHIGGMHWFEDGKLKDVYSGRLGTVCAIRPDRQGNVWVASDSQGLFKFKDDQIIAHYTTVDGLPSNDVKVIHQSPDGVLWFGTYGGLVRLKDDKFTVWTVKNGLASDRVRSIYEDADGTLWIGTYDGGLSRFRDGRFFNFTINNGLSNNGVFCILEDRRQNFWISSNRGIYRVNRRELNEFAEGRLAQINCVAYGKQDGMLNTECNGGRQPAGIITRDGKMWFPTMDGVAVIDPESVTANPLPPPVQIETVAIDRNNVAFTSGAQVNPSQTSLDITYTALSLIKSDLIRFKYRMEGLDGNWVDAGTRRTAYYSYLPQGEYTFRVMAANADGVWSTTSASVKVSVKPPFYRTRWFLALALIMVTGLALLGYTLRVRQLEHARAAQEAFSRRLLAAQEQERQRIAAELHDGLGQSLLVIKNRALIGGMKPGDETDAREQFDLISVATSQAIEEVRHIAYNLRPHHLARLGLTQTLEAMIEQVAASTPIHFATNIAVLDGIFSKEGEIVFYRIIQESINNIVKHSHATEVGIEIRRYEDSVTARIQDNGQGFAAQSAENGDRQGGFGLIGIAERVRILNGTHTIESTPGLGVTITMTFNLLEDVQGDSYEA